MPAAFQGKSTELLGAGKRWLGDMRLLIPSWEHLAPKWSGIFSIWESLGALGSLRTPCNLCALFGAYAISCRRVLKVPVPCSRTPSPVRHLCWPLVQDGVAWRAREGIRLGCAAGGDEGRDSALQHPVPCAGNAVQTSRCSQAIRWVENPGGISESACVASPCPSFAEKQVPGGLSRAGAAGDRWPAGAGNEKGAAVFDPGVVHCFPDFCFYL